MKCSHCGYTDDKIPESGIHVAVCPQCGIKLDFDIAEPISTDDSTDTPQEQVTPELKVAKAVHVGFGDFAGNLAANVTVSTGTQKAATISQNKVTLDSKLLGIEEPTVSGTHLSTDDMLLGLDPNENMSESIDDTVSNVEDVYTKIQAGFNKRQAELDELEKQLRIREANIQEQEKHLEEEIKLNRESAEDYLKAKKMYESHENSINNHEVVFAEKTEKTTVPGYLRTLLRIFSGIFILLLILLLFLAVALNKANKQISVLQTQILSTKQSADSTSPLLLQMRSDYQQLQNLIQKNAANPEENEKQISAMEAFLNKYEYDNTLSGTAEILTIELRLSNCKNFRRSQHLQKIMSSSADNLQK